MLQLAAILEVSTDELLLGGEPRGAELEISDVRLLDEFQRLQHLDKRDREAVITGALLLPLDFTTTFDFVAIRNESLARLKAGRINHVDRIAVDVGVQTVSCAATLTFRGTASAAR